MVGRRVSDLFPPWQATIRDEIVLEVQNLRCRGVYGIDLTARSGEIFGIGGLLGQGQEEAMLGLYGAIAVTTDRFTVSGSNPGPSTVIEANARGIAYVPADRKRDGLLLPLSIGFNLILPAVRQLARRGLRRLRREAETIRQLMADLTVRGGNPNTSVERLSGGNQQKIALAKWLPLSPTVFLLNDPTRGVDIETKREIYLRLRQMAASGSAVLLLSSDTLELMHVCDRVAVFRQGRIAATLDRGHLSEEAIVAASVGLSASQDKQL